MDPWTPLNNLKLAILAATAIFPPLCTPQIWVLSSPASQTPSPEETASIFSLLFFGFVDAMVFKAWAKARKGESLGFEDLPPLLSVDEADYRESTSMKFCF
jgi:hypothetical protein